MVKRFYCRSSPDLQKSEFCSSNLVEKHCFQTVQNNSSRRINEMYWGNILPNVNYKQYCLKHDFNQEWHPRSWNTAQNSSRNCLHSRCPVACRVSLNLDYEAHTTEYELHPLNIPFTFNPCSHFLVWRSKTSMQYRMKCWITLVQKGEASKSVLIRISLQWKHIEMCRLLLPSVSNSYLLSQEQIFKHKSQPPSKAQIQTGVFQAQLNLRSN